MAMAVMHRVTSGLFAAMLSAMVVGAASLHFREQSPPRATLAGRPPPLDRANSNSAWILRCARREWIRTWYVRSAGIRALSAGHAPFGESGGNACVY